MTEQVTVAGELREINSIKGADIDRMNKQEHKAYLDACGAKLSEMHNAPAYKAKAARAALWNTVVDKDTVSAAVSSFLSSAPFANLERSAWPLIGTVSIDQFCGYYHVRFRLCGRIGYPDIDFAVWDGTKWIVLPPADSTEVE
jgi:hypothetical protein